MDYLQNTLYKDDIAAACKNIPAFERLYETRILITGATGLVGSFLVDMLRYMNRYHMAQIQIFAASRSYQKLEERFGKEENDLHYVVADICGEFRFDLSVDYVIHAAANSYPALFREDPAGTIMKSVEGTRNVLDFAQNCGAKRFLFVSSGEVYGQYKTKGSGHKETENGTVDILSARSCYPLGKQVAENLCICYAEQYHLPIVIARLCHTFGPNALESDNRAHMQFIRSAASHKNSVLNSEGLQERSYLYIADSAAAIFTVLLHGQEKNVYNIASQETITIRGFAETCATVSDNEVDMRLAKNESKIEKSPINRQVLDGYKLRKLGWKAQFSIREGISHSVQILRDCAVGGI